MSRMRQIPVMDATQREQMLLQNQPSGIGSNPKQPNYHPAMYNASRPTPNCRPRMRKLPATKLRLSDTPALISNGCSSVRQLCNNVQSITADLNNLIGSVESMVPLLNTYLTVLQNRNTMQEQELDPPIEVGNQSTVTDVQEQASQSRPQPNIQDTSSAPQNNTTSAIPKPRPEDIQQLLENPLVQNLLTGFMQNSAFPNTNMVKENALNQQQMGK